MSFSLSIAQKTGDPLVVDLKQGESLFVLGPNGAGKSGLMTQLYNQNKQQAQRISAHRQTWFSSNSVTILPQQKRDIENNIRGGDSQPDSRWKDDYSTQRASIAIYELVESENARARGIAGAVDAGDISGAQMLAKVEAPVKVINALLRQSNLPIEISVDGDQVLAKKSGSEPFSIAKLSDGERNALLIAANVLTVPPETLLVIDEPERHLHRSIISPLLTLLFAQRPDCSFVVSTHDLMLCVDNPSSKVLLVRDCSIVSGSVGSWDVDLLESAADIDEHLKQDILGARRKILFDEGVAGTSLDEPLYSLIFPGVSVVAKAGCREVERAVLGVRDSTKLHWIEAFGIIDGDGRDLAEIAELEKKGIYALDVYSVESIYYDPVIQQKVALRQCELVGGDPTAKLEAAKTAALTALGPHGDRLALRIAEKSVRQQFTDQLPAGDTISSATTPISITVDAKSILDAEKRRYHDLLQSQDLEALIARYPVRETGALAAISGKLGFQDRRSYEQAVRKLLMSDAAALDHVRGRFKNLTEVLTTCPANAISEPTSLVATTAGAPLP